MRSTSCGDTCSSTTSRRMWRNGRRCILKGSVWCGTFHMRSTTALICRVFTIGSMCMNGSALSGRLENVDSRIGKEKSDGDQLAENARAHQLATAEIGEAAHCGVPTASDARHVRCRL